ncbi:DUF7946 domain-containing protein [Rhodobacter capsulatus]
MEIKLSYTGRTAEAHQLDFYDAAQAMVGFQRSLALTAHLVINGTIITQAPSLKGAKRLCCTNRLLSGRPLSPDRLIPRLL